MKETRNLGIEPKDRLETRQRGTSSMEMKRRRRQPRQTLLATVTNGVVVDSVEAKEPAS